MSRLPPFLLALFVSLCLEHPAAAQSGAVYSVAVEDLDLRPFARAEGGIYTGYGRDVLDAFAASRGVTFEYRPMPLRRLIVEFLDGQHDLKFPDSPTWRDDLRGSKQIYYSDPISRYSDGIFVRPDAANQGVANLKQLSTLRGFTLPPGIDRGRVTVIEHPDIPSMLRFVLAGRSDGALGTTESIRYHLNASLQQPEALTFDRSLPAHQDYYRLSSIKHPEVIHELNDWLAANGNELDAIRRRWGIDSDRQSVAARSEIFCRAACGR